MQKDVILTPEGLEKLQAELEHLQTDKRREVAQRIKEAREFGDISENSEYDDAKNEQAQLEAEIALLAERLREAVIVDRVRMRVKIEDPDGKRAGRETDYDLLVTVPLHGGSEAIAKSQAARISTPPPKHRPTLSPASSPTASSASRNPSSRPIGSRPASSSGRTTKTWRPASNAVLRSRASAGSRPPSPSCVISTAPRPASSTPGPPPPSAISRAATA